LISLRTSCWRSVIRSLLAEPGMLNLPAQTGGLGDSARAWDFMPADFGLLVLAITPPARRFSALSRSARRLYELLDRLVPHRRLGDLARQVRHQADVADVHDRMEDGADQVLDADRIGVGFAAVGAGLADDLAHAQAAAGE